MGWKERQQKGEGYFKDVAKLFSSQGYIVEKTGIEQHYSQIHVELRNLPSDLTAKFFRYQPDGFYIATKENKSVYFDAKSADSIEKDAFLIYQKMQSIGLNVLICIKNNINDEYHVWIENLCLISGSVSTKRNHLPVDDEDWLAPRLWLDPNSIYYNPEKYKIWKQKCHGSGTPHRYFDFNSMEEFNIDPSKRPNVIRPPEPKIINNNDFEQWTKNVFEIDEERRKNNIF